MAISTIYEVSKPTYQFYAVERSGYVDVGTLVTDVLTDMTKEGKFEFKSTKLKDTNDFIISTPEFPIVERLVKIANPGVGYKVGTVLEVALATGPNIKITVANIVPLTGAVLEVNVAFPGSYETPTVQNAATFIAKDYTPVSSNVVAYANTITVSHTINGNTSNSVGAATTVPVPSASIGTTTADQTQWNTDYGSTGSGGKSGTKWPTTGIWFAANTALGFQQANVFVGQDVELDSSVATNAPTSVIPPGTKIVSLNKMQYISGIKSVPIPGSGPNYEENLGDGVYLILNNPVTLKKGDRLAFKGVGLTISNNETKPPKSWTAIVEAQGAVDPLNDPLGVTGDVRVSGTNSQYIEITSIANAPNVPYRPRIHEGQSVTSTALNGSIGPGDLVFVSEVTTNAEGTIANVRLSRSLSTVTAGETLQFKFDQLQPWRMAFEVLENKTNANVGPQAVTVYAATDIQLEDNGNIANIFLSTGTGASLSYKLTDRAGIMGGLPTGTSAALAPTDPTEGFINRAVRAGSDPRAYPFNYALTMTDRGIFWGVWEGTWSTMQKTKNVGINGDSFFNWLLIQRPVNRNTGKVLTKGRAPVFCINSVGYKYWKFIVREEDVLHPTIGDPNNKRQRWDYANAAIINDSVPYRVPADTNTQDSFAILNTANQVALTEDSKYLVSFLHNLSTPRFRYSEELDMIGQTSADVCMAGTDISIAAYSELGSRTYRALPANNPYNTGLRIAVLKDISQVEP